MMVTLMLFALLLIGKYRRGANITICMYTDDVFLFFFFQAEDGIRDYKVTGVQTCALPISRTKPQVPRTNRDPGKTIAAVGGSREHLPGNHEALDFAGALADRRQLDVAKEQIGRASCRERV